MNLRDFLSLRLQPFSHMRDHFKIPFIAVLFSSLIASLWAIENFAHFLYHPGSTPYGRILRIWHYPWTDMVENVIVGYNLANGLRFEHDTVVIHLPGIPQYLAIFFKLFGLAHISPSAVLVPIALTISAFAVTLFEFFCLYAAFRIIDITRGRSLLAAFCFLGGSLLIFYSVILPLSENVIPFILLVQFACLHKIIDPKIPLANRLQLAAWSLSFLPLINLLTGLTVALSVIFLWLVVLVLSVNLIRSNWKFVFALPRAPLVVPFVLAIGLLGYEAMTLDLNAFWFWAVKINKNNVTEAPYLAIANAPYRQLVHFTVPRLPGGGLWDFALISGLFYYVRKKKKLFKKEDKYFLLICFISALLGCWRKDFGHFKSGTIAGISWYLLLALLPVFWKQMTITDIRLPLKQIAALAFCAVLTISLLIGLPLERQVGKTSTRPEAFETANVCRFRSTEPCRCLQITSFSPQTFLENDIRQCTDRYSSFASVLFANDSVRNNLIEDFSRDDVAFLVYPETMLEVYEANRDKRIINMLYGGGLHCIPYAGDTKICYKG